MAMRAPRWRKRLIGAALGVAAATVAAFVAVDRLVDAWGPLDVSVGDRFSTIVVDRDGRLLRPFLSEEGRWRLPAKTGDVDTRFLALLKAYEDRRFDDHSGVDAVALLRAGGQFLRSGRIVSGGSTLTMQVVRLLEQHAADFPPP